MKCKKSVIAVAVIAIAILAGIFLFSSSSDKPMTQENMNENIDNQMEKIGDNIQKMNDDTEERHLN